MSFYYCLEAKNSVRLRFISLTLSFLLFLSLVTGLGNVYLLVVYTMLYLWQLYIGIYSCLVACQNSLWDCIIFHFNFLFPINGLSFFSICVLPYRQNSPNRIHKTAVWKNFTESLLWTDHFAKYQSMWNQASRTQLSLPGTHKIIQTDQPSGPIDTVLSWPFSLTRLSRVNLFHLRPPTLSFAQEGIRDQCLSVCNWFL